MKKIFSLLVGVVSLAACATSGLQEGEGTSQSNPSTASSSLLTIVSPSNGSGVLSSEHVSAFVRLAPIGAPSLGTVGGLRVVNSASQAVSQSLEEQSQ